MLDQMKIGAATLAIGILMTFGLIATAAENLPADAQTIVTTEQAGPGDRNGRGDRDGGRRGNRGDRDNRGPDMVDIIFDLE